MFVKYKGALAFAGLCLIAMAAPVNAEQFDIEGPAGSVSFGAWVQVLPSGNIVVVDPDAGGTAPKAGAVHLYTPGGTLISTLVGSSSGDRVGSAGVKVLPNGHFLVLSPNWGSSSAAETGAVTWVNGNAGLSGVVSPDNSLIGATADPFGDISITMLSNGNYVVSSPRWDNGSITNAGAVTWANGETGLSGLISADNSLIGEAENDCVGGQCIFGLAAVVASPNGNYIVESRDWNNGAASAAGAVTWVDGTRGLVGKVSAANSLVGSTTNDGVGSGYVSVLADGNFVIASPNWSNGATSRAGAVSWISGVGGRSGAVSAANSLVGVTANDQVGSGGVTVLGNGNYVVASPQWNGGASFPAQRLGAATWASGSHGISGAVSPENSLVGASGGEEAGRSVTALSNGNYVVNSDFGLCGCGALTWGDGSTGIRGNVSPSNSLLGRLNDSIGAVVALTNGNYVVVSPWWGNGEGSAPRLGAITWAAGDRPAVGVVTSANSLVGTSPGDRVGSEGVVALANGNYVVMSSYWHAEDGSLAGAVTWRDGRSGSAGAVSTNNSLTGTSFNGLTGEYSARATALNNGHFVVVTRNWSSTTEDAVGAVTWGNGHSGITGMISPQNSLVGGSGFDNVGSNGVVALADGNYVVSSPGWSNGTLSRAGAVTWANGNGGVAGNVSQANSLVGTTENDTIGKYGVLPLGSEHYLVTSHLWNNDAVRKSGAMTLASSRFRQSGAIQPYNSVLGSSADGGMRLRYAFDGVRKRLLVGRPADRTVSLFTMDQIFADSFL